MSNGFTEPSGWADGDAPLVSVCIIAFNHANYIGQCIEGVLMQKADFGIEILVHDDASTDGTVQILQEYERAFPQFIKVFYETENQFGKGTYKGGYRRGLLEPASRGKYIACIEGDDYWCDPNKLARQVGYLEEHDETLLSCHAAVVQDGVSGSEIGTMGMGPDDKDLTPNEVIRNWAVPTASWVYRKGALDSYMDWTFDKPVGDFPFVLYSATVGRVRYFHEPMSAYRYQTPGSWTSRVLGGSNVYDNACRWLGMYESIDKVTSGCYHDDLIAAAMPKLRAALVVSDLNYSSSFIEEAKGGLSFSNIMTILLKRLLRSFGVDVVRTGYGSSSRRRIVRK